MGYNIIHTKCDNEITVCAGRLLDCASEKKYTTPGVSGGRGEVLGHTWWTVPAQEMLLCNLPGAGGPGGAEEPEPRDQREPPTAGRTPEDRLVAHDAT